MNRLTSKRCDAVFGKSAALDAVLDLVDYGAANSCENTKWASGDSLAKSSESPSKRVTPGHENEKRRLPWLGR
ncbi:hypothetical protein [Novipirellula artificiosorum]|uniref:Uncharacterized protein n=1 Tax=Novipirellula artificiosorum TaxID=2528016 RepID=A0A5C6D9A9_9BACT|nr:hypothetical protein [Novipirellula artificiosorum]TWU31806.1 hypothetical protein Poly41_60410 [Novipirellula artificiosorum]